MARSSKEPRVKSRTEKAIEASGRNLSFENANTTHAVRFNPDSSVDVKIGNKQENLNPEEKRQLESQQKARAENPNLQGFPQSPKVSNLLNEDARQKEIARLQQEKQQKDLAAEVQAPALNAAKTEIGQSIPTRENIQEQEQARVAEENKKPVVALRKSVVAVAEIVKGIIDFSFSRQPATHKEAVATFTQASSALDNNIQGVKDGTISFNDATRSLQEASLAINRLEEYQHFVGKLNIRYWLSDGKEIEADIILEKQRLDLQRIELINAAAQVAIQ